MEYFQYFPSWICREEFPSLAAATLANVVAHIAARKEEQFPPNVIQTADLSQEPQFQELGSIFTRTSTQILNDQGYLINNYNFWLSSMWAQSIQTNGYQPEHTHRDSVMCGLFFLQTPENGSYPIFSDPRPSKTICDLDMAPSHEVTAAIPHVHFNNVLPGTLLLFNNWLPHIVTPNGAQEPTTFLHFLINKHRK